MRIYAACLASYNNGVLHGRWIDASSDIEEMQEEINAMLRESRFPNVTVTITCTECHNLGELFPGVTCPLCKGRCEIDVPSAEEWAIHDSEGLPRMFGEFSGLQAVADFVELVEDNDWIDEDAIVRIVDDAGSIDEARDRLDDNYVGIYDSFRDYADETADEMIGSDGQSDSFIARYFDYASFARDLQMDMHTVSLNDGRVAVFHA